MRRPLLLLALLVGLALPFLGKPVHLDDANFLRLAQGARLDAWRPHAVRINWQGQEQAAFDVLSNPPGIAWWLAPVLDQPVWVLHLWMLPWLVLLVAGAWMLARRFGGGEDRAAAGALLLAGGPLALLATQSLMPDLPLLACALAGLGGLVLAPTGGLARRWPWALLLGCAALFRYSGLALLPLVVLWALLHRERRGALILGVAAAAPISALLLHDALAYGQLHLLAMQGFQAAEGVGARAGLRRLIALVAMLGGAGVLPILCWARPKAAAVGGALGLVLGLTGVWLSEQGGVAALGTLLAATAGGASLGGAAGQSDRDALWLQAWLFGGLVFLLQLRFAAARYWLPFFAPAVLIPLRLAPRGLLRGAALLSTVLGLFLAAADQDLARAQARLAASVLDRASGETGIFAGHWGFQHHLEAAGWVALEEDAPIPAETLFAVSAVAWPQSPAPGACLKPEGRFVDAAPYWRPRIHSATAAVNIHADVVSDRPPVESYAPWGFGGDPLDVVTLWRGCPTRTDPAPAR